MAFRLFKRTLLNFKRRGMATMREYSGSSQREVRRSGYLPKFWISKILDLKKSRSDLMLLSNSSEVIPRTCFVP